MTQVTCKVCGGPLYTGGDCIDAQCAANNPNMIYTIAHSHSIPIGIKGQHVHCINGNSCGKYLGMGAYCGDDLGAICENCRNIPAPQPMPIQYTVPPMPQPLPPALFIGGIFCSGVLLTIAIVILLSSSILKG